MTGAARYMPVPVKGPSGRVRIEGAGSPWRDKRLCAYGPTRTAYGSGKILFPV